MAASLGMVTYPLPDVKDRILRFFRMAAERGLSADFHVDETGDPTSNTLRLIAEAVLETGFDKPVVVGHCCSVSMMDEAEALATLDLVAKAGLHVVSLPMCNLYLQDRRRGPHPALARHHDGARDEGAGHQRQLRLGQHPRSVLCLWRHGHGRGAARGDADRASGPQRHRLGAARS